MKKLSNNGIHRRITWIDYFKSFGIILMILGHISIGKRYSLFIHAFNMPMFFFISGVLFKPAINKENFIKIIKKKVKTLLLPYVCVFILHYSLWLITNYTYKNLFFPLSSFLWVNNDSMPSTFGALWFLTAFFFAQIIYYIIDTFIKRKSLKNIIIFFITIFGFVSKSIFALVLPWSLDASLVGVGLMHIGRILCEFDNKKRKFLFNEKINIKKIIFILLGGLITSVLIFLNGSVNMRTGIYSNIILFLVNAVLASLVGIGVAQLLEAIVKKKNFKIVDFLLTNISINAIIYICFNQIVIYYITKIISTSDLLLIKILYKLVIFFGTILILSIINIIVDKSKFMRTLFGLKFDKKLSAICYLILIIMLCGSIFHEKNRYINYRKELVNISSNVQLANTEKINNKNFNDEKIISSIATENIDYLLNEHVNEVIKYSFLNSSNINKYNGNNNYENNIIKETEEIIKHWKNNGDITLPNITGERTNENAVRPWAHISYVLSINLKFNIVDFYNTNYNYDKVKSMTKSLIEELASKHCSNYYSGWGNSWQTAEWAENIGFASWLMWDDLSDDTKADVTNMIIYEANRFIDYQIPYYKDKTGKITYDGDTKGEENAWNSRILALATCMYPDNENNKKWEDALIKLLISSTSAPKDLDSNNVIDNYKIKDVLNGSNINDDGTVINHNRYHIDYSACIAEGMADTIIIYALSDKPMLESSIFNVDLLYQALVEVDLGKYDKSKQEHHFYERTNKNTASIDINMPGDNDWGGKWYASYYLLDTIVDTFELDKNIDIKAKYWSKSHLEYIDDQITNNEGKYFSNNENYFVSGETYMAHNMCKAYLIRLLLANDMYK